MTNCRRRRQHAADETACVPHASGLCKASKHSAQQIALLEYLPHREPAVHVEAEAEEQCAPAAAPAGGAGGGPEAEATGWESAGRTCQEVGPS